MKSPVGFLKKGIVTFFLTLMLKCKELRITKTPFEKEQNVFPFTRCPLYCLMFEAEELSVS